ncbi:UNKNOWN [Stylonychia lemnae]|uniref:Right handed beta helix domain-containing protein n=1 Tax=Stylonychia lemnae TaxID=5949 RepID=A0A077ZU31_STYLE|nr:UNKNOWN [Stylonychia lemnae]|eukprot:CDW73382.1 UNKNOWN [Stylonychia lemnae]
MDDNSVNFIETQFNLQYPTPFAISNVDIIHVRLSNFQNCFYQQRGGVFKLQNTTLYDEGSIFSFNQAMSGGAVYCEKCHAIFNKTQFTNNFAQNGGSISVNGSSNIKFFQNLVQNTFAYNNGGFINVFTQNLEQEQAQTQSRILKNYIIPNITISENKNLEENNLLQNERENRAFYRQLNTLEILSLLQITQQSQIRQTYAYNNGGAIYVDSNDLNVEIDDLFQQSSRSYKQMGGFIHSENSRSISIAHSNFTQYQSASGSFLASVGVDTGILISNSRFDKNKEFIVPGESEYSQLSQQDSFGTIYVSNAESLLLMNNQFYNNYYSKILDQPIEIVLLIWEE